jgi:hypothetical protein
VEKVRASRLKTEKKISEIVAFLSAYVCLHCPALVGGLILYSSREAQTCPASRDSKVYSAVNFYQGRKYDPETGFGERSSSADSHDGKVNINININPRHRSKYLEECSPDGSLHDVDSSSDLDIDDGLDEDADRDVDVDHDENVDPDQCKRDLPAPADFSRDYGVRLEGGGMREW